MPIPTHQTRAAVAFKSFPAGAATEATIAQHFGGYVVNGVQMLAAGTLSVKDLGGVTEAFQGATLPAGMKLEIQIKEVVASSAAYLLLSSG